MPISSAPTARVVGSRFMSNEAVEMNAARRRATVVRDALIAEGFVSEQIAVDVDEDDASMNGKPMVTIEVVRTAR